MKHVWMVHEIYEGYDEIHLYKNMDDAYSHGRNEVSGLTQAGYNVSEYSPEKNFIKDKLRKDHFMRVELVSYGTIVKIEIRRIKVD